MLVFQVVHVAPSVARVVGGVGGALHVLVFALGGLNGGGSLVLLGVANDEMEDIYARVDVGTPVELRP